MRAAIRKPLRRCVQTPIAVSQADNVTSFVPHRSQIRRFERREDAIIAGPSRAICPAERARSEQWICRGPPFILQEEAVRGEVKNARSGTLESGFGGVRCRSQCRARKHGENWFGLSGRARKPREIPRRRSRWCCRAAGHLSVGRLAEVRIRKYHWWPGWGTRCLHPHQITSGGHVGHQAIFDEVTPLPVSKRFERNQVQLTVRRNQEVCRITQKRCNGSSEPL